MKTTDNRHYNRKYNRDLSIEMDLFILLKGKTLTSNASVNGVPANGVITNIEYNPGKIINTVKVYLENGTYYLIPVKYGKMVKTEQYNIK